MCPCGHGRPTLIPPELQGGVQNRGSLTKLGRPLVLLVDWRLRSLHTKFHIDTDARSFHLNSVESAHISHSKDMSPKYSEDCKQPLDEARLSHRSNCADRSIKCGRIYPGRSIKCGRIDAGRSTPKCGPIYVSRSTNCVPVEKKYYGSSIKLLWTSRLDRHL